MVGVGERGLLNLDGIIEFKFDWRLGRKTNNQAEMYGHFQGLHIVKDKGIKDIIILRDSLITIHYLIKEGNPNDNSVVGASKNQRIGNILPFQRILPYSHNQ